MKVKKKKQGDETGAKSTNTELRPLIMQQDSPCCPVLSFEKYISHLDPTVNHLWQQPKRRVNVNFDEVWYTKIPVGQGTIGDFLKTVSE